MGHRLDEIAAALGARLEGRADIVIEGAAEPADAAPTDLAMAMKPEFAADLPRGRARAAVLWDGADWQAMGLEAALFVPRPRYAMAGITAVLAPPLHLDPGIHPMAVIHPTAEIGPGAAIGPFVVIGPGVRIGARARIASQCSIDDGARIGDDLLLHAGARIGPRVRIGHRFIGHCNAVVGGDGFSFVTPEKSSVEEIRETHRQVTGAQAQRWTRIASLGTVELGDDVELGCNSAIDRGTIRATRVGSGTKIDNLVQIGHNAVIGTDCMICGQAGVAGSARIGNRVVLGGRVAVNDNIFVGDDVIGAGGAAIFTNVPAGRVVMGNPAVKLETQMEINKAVRRLPRLAQQVAELKKAVFNTSDPG